MESKIDLETARRLAITACAGVKLGDWHPQGITTSAAAAEALKTIVNAEVTTPLTGSRLSPSGQPLDFWAPSPWHALCATELQSYVGRAARGSYRQALNDPLARFGRRPFYRGQARAWDIRPSGWR